MPQLLLQGFPIGATRIGPFLSVLKKEGHVTYFVGADNFYSHSESDMDSQRFVIASLIANSHVRASEVEQSELGVPYRTLMNWTGQLATHGPRAFFEPRARRGGAVMTDKKAAECARFLDSEKTIAAAARLAGVDDSTLRKAIKSGRVRRSSAIDGTPAPASVRATNKSERGRADARAAEGMGTACTRANERMEAAMQTS